jgi:phosphoglucomutase
VYKRQRAHWAKYGRNYYSRHDYEAVDTTKADALMSALRAKLPLLVGQVLEGQKVVIADDFSYTDPIDGSVSNKQGVRLIFENGSRVVFRLSGTGTEGATLRVYLEQYEPEVARQRIETQAALAPLIAIAQQVAGITAHTGRSAPSVVT